MTAGSFFFFFLFSFSLSLSLSLFLVLCNDMLIFVLLKFLTSRIWKKGKESKCLLLLDLKYTVRGGMWACLHFLFFFYTPLTLFFIIFLHNFIIPFVFPLHILLSPPSPPPSSCLSFLLWQILSASSILSLLFFCTYTESRIDITNHIKRVFNESFSVSGLHFRNYSHLREHRVCACLLLIMIWRIARWTVSWIVSHHTPRMSS